MRRTLDGDTREHRFTWRNQVDVKAIEAADARELEGPSGTITDYALAGYSGKSSWY